MENKYELIKPESTKDRKRVGRGTSSGHGKTSCRGQKGQKSRSGSKRKAGFEGGQMPLQRRVPKRGFNNVFKQYYQTVNLGQILKTDSEIINPEILLEMRIIKKADKLVKILGKAELGRSVKITADAFSDSARECIEKAGGEALIRDTIN